MELFPSPKSQRYDVMVPVEVSENATVSGSVPFVGVPENPATGAANTVIVNPLASTPDFPSMLVTATFHWPAVLPVRSKVHVILVGETMVTLVLAMSVDPVRFSLTVAPDRKPVPVRFVMLIVFVFTPVFGVIDPTVGGAPTKDTSLNTCRIIIPIRKNVNPPPIR